MSDSASYLAYIASVPRPRAGAGALLRDNQGRVLVVHPVYKDEGSPSAGSLAGGTQDEETVLDADSPSGGSAICGGTDSVPMLCRTRRRTRATAHPAGAVPRPARP